MSLKMPKDNKLVEEKTQKKPLKKNIWEKERRDHLKQAFIKLEKLLPSYDPSNAASRIDVINKSIEYIEEMRNIIQELLKPHSEVNPKALKLKNLQERIKQLVGRMEILSRLLREAKIPIPHAHKWKDFKQKNRKWSGRINDKKISVPKEKNGNNRENELMNADGSTPVGNGKTKSKSNPSSLVPKHRKNIVNRFKNELASKQTATQPATSNCLIIYTQAFNTPPCYLVNSAPSTNLAGSSKTVITNSIVASNPVMATNVKGNKGTVIESDSKVQSLGAGTLILTNGNIFPVLPQAQPILPTPMLLQVTNNSNTTIVKSESDKTRNNETMHQKPQKNLKKIAKKSINKTPFINVTNACNVISKNSISDVCMTSRPNIFPSGPNLVMAANQALITAQMNNKVPILPAPRIFKTKVPFTLTNRRKIKGKRIGDKPVSRKALKMLRNRNKKIEAEKEDIKKLKMNISQKNETQSQKDSLNGVNSKSKLDIAGIPSREGLKGIEKVDDAECTAITQNIHTQKGISVINDDIVKTSGNGVSSIYEINPKITASGFEQTSAKNTERRNLKLDDKIAVEINGSKSEETKSYEEENLSLEKNLHKKPADTELHLNASEQSVTTNNEIELKQIVDVPQVVKLAEKTQKSTEESKSEMHISNPSTNEEQNLRPDSNLDLDNVCSMNQQLKHLDIHLGHSELSNDIFASLQVPSGCQNPESTSPTAAFLLAFPLVSSLTGVKVTEVMDEDHPDSQRETPTLLQIGNMDTTKSAQSESFTPNLLNLDFFSAKDIYSGFYNTFEQHLSGLTMPPTVSSNESPKGTVKNVGGTKFGDNFRTSSFMDNINTSSMAKHNSINRQTSSTVTSSEAQNIRSIDCQPNYSFEAKQTNAISTSVEGPNIPPSVLYLDKTVMQSNSDKETNISNHQRADMQKSTKLNEKVSLQNPQTNILIAKDDTRSKIVSSTDKNVDEKIFNSFMKRDIFNVENINNDLSNVHKNIEQVNGINFYPEKQKPAITKDFNLQNSTPKNANMQLLFRENIHDVQMPFTTSRNFTATSMNSNEINPSFNIENNSSFASKNMNIKTYNQQSQQVDSSQKAIIHPYYIPDNKNFALSSQNNAKPANVDNRNTETQKYFNYNNLNSENKKTLKNNEINFNYNQENKIVPVPKMGESKQITPSYNMTYSNTSYDITNITKVSTCAYSSTKLTSEPLYTNSNSNNYNYYPNSESYLNETCYKSVKTDKNHAALDLENYANYKKTDFNNTYYSDNQRKNNITAKSENAQEKSTYNWMTTPTKTTTDHIIPNFSKDDTIYSNANLINSNQTSYFNPTSLYSNDLNSNLNQTTKKTFDLPLVNMNYQKPEVEEGQNQFTWSPTKMPQFLDPVPSFVTSTLPTLVGDLALGSSNFQDQKYEIVNKCTKETKNKTSTKMSFENQNTFFSVSQLVHQNDKTVPVKSTRRRNSGSLARNNQMKIKKTIKNNEEPKEVPQCFNKSPGSQGHVKIENKNFNCRQTNHNTFCDKRSSIKVSSSIYSAESLIGHQGNSEHNSKKDQLFAGNSMKNIPVPPYISDNIMPYFPPVDLQQDNLMQQNQNYQNFPSFTTFSNNSYSANTFIPSTTISTPYICPSNFVADTGIGNEFSTENMHLFPNTSMNKNKLANKNNAGHREEKNTHNNPCTDNVTKKKRKSVNEMNVPTNLVDFSFLSVPGSINSPLLPDDFHSHSTFLPPPTQPQLYPCKNTLYPPKQSTITSATPLLPLPPIPAVTRSVIHPEISPSLNSVGTSLTNFNLSTIFPEMNKGSMTDIYSDNQSKEQNANRHYPNSSVSFNSKSTFPYPNGPITQPYGIDNR